MHGLQMLTDTHEPHLNQGFIYHYSNYLPRADVRFLFDSSIYERNT